MTSSKILTKTDKKMQDTWQSVQDDPLRSELLTRARSFKRTWIELAESLSKVHKKEAWTPWGFSTFEDYCKKELHLRMATVHKLLGSYRFLSSSAPQVLKTSTNKTATIPPLTVVDFVARAQERGAADKKTMAEMKRLAFEENATAPALNRQFKSLAFPTSPEQDAKMLTTQLRLTIRRMTTLLANPDLPASRNTIEQTEVALGGLLQELDDKDKTLEQAAS